MEKSDSTERADEREDRRLPFSLADSTTLTDLLESGRDWRGMARGEEVGEGMLAVGGLTSSPTLWLTRGGKCEVDPRLSGQVGSCHKPPFLFRRRNQSATQNQVGRGCEEKQKPRRRVYGSSRERSQRAVQKSHTQDDRREMTVLSVALGGLSTVTRGRRGAVHWRLLGKFAGGCVTVPYTDRCKRTKLVKVQMICRLKMVGSFSVGQSNFIEYLSFFLSLLSLWIDEL